MDQGMCPQPYHLSLTPYSMKRAPTLLVFQFPHTSMTSAQVCISNLTYVILLFVETGSHCVALTELKLYMQARLAQNSQISILLPLLLSTDTKSLFKQVGGTRPLAHIHVHVLTQTLKMSYICTSSLALSYLLKSFWGKKRCFPTNITCTSDTLMGNNKCAH